MNKLLCRLFGHRSSLGDWAQTYVSMYEKEGKKIEIFEKLKQKAEVNTCLRCKADLSNRLIPTRQVTPMATHLGSCGGCGNAITT